MTNTIGIVILATNIYFVLALRLIKNFIFYYTGECKLNFYVFSDTCITDFLPPDIDNVHFYYSQNKNWVEGTNSKFLNIISIEDDLKNCDYVYYFDADTNVYKQFDEKMFLGEIVAGQHYNNSYTPKKPYDRNPKSKAYVPEDTELEQIYYYGAFFGGNVEKVLRYVKIFRAWQLEDKKIKYEPRWNDESYLNKYFHYNRPTLIVPSKDFGKIFGVSDKGGINQIRNTKNKIPDEWLQILIENKDKIFKLIKNKLEITDISFIKN